MTSKNNEEIEQLNSNKEALLATIENVNLLVTAWNPFLGITIQTILNNVKYSINESSAKKFQERLSLMHQSISKIQEAQKTKESNLEAFFLCPELFRQSLIIDDNDRAKELLQFTEKLFTAGKLEFDRISEAMRIISNLSSLEYKILKKVQNNFTSWESFFNDQELLNFKNSYPEDFKFALFYLRNNNLVEIEKPFVMDATNNLSIDFNDKEEKIKLSYRGKLFLDTFENVE